MTNTTSTGNWFENHPTKSIIIYTITIAAVTWGIFGYLLDDRKENLHKNELKLLQQKIDNNELTETQLLARIELLEKENNILREKNYKYYEWISNSASTLGFIEKENSSLKMKLSTKTKPDLIENNTTSRKEKYFIQTSRLDVGNAFIDNFTGASLCVTRVDIGNVAIGYYNLPNKKRGDFTDLKPGNSWEFEYLNKKYILYLQEVDFPSSTYKVLLKEE